MAAGDFTSMLRVQKRLSTMFPGSNTAQPELNEPAASAQALLRAQQAKVDEILEGSKCVGVKAYFLRTSGLGTVDAAETCATPCGVEAQEVSKNFDSEILAQAAGFVEDGRCASEIDFETESAGVIDRLMAVLRGELNELVLTRIAANVQTNKDEGIPADWDDTTDAPIINVPAEQFNEDEILQTLGEIQVTAENNDLSAGYMILSGRALSILKWKEGYNALNSDGKANNAAMNDFNLQFDTRDLDRVIGRRATFVIDRNSYVFWNSRYSGLTTTPKLMDSTTGKYQWMIADPILRYRRGGQLVPVMYMAEMSKTCIERTILGEPRYKYCYYLTLVGGFDTIPDGPDGETGILEFDAV
jgi:hypothetical protein